MTTTTRIHPTFQGRCVPYALPEVTFDATKVLDDDGEQAVVGFQVLYSNAVFYGDPDTMASYFEDVARSLRSIAEALRLNGGDTDAVGEAQLASDRHAYYRGGIGL